MTSPDSLTARARAPEVPMSRPITAGISGVSTDHLRLPRWVGPGARAGQGAGQAGKFESCFELHVIETERWTERGVIVEPRQESRAESVAGPDGVDDFDVRGVDVHPDASMRAERTPSAERHDDQAHAGADNLFSRLLVVEPRVDPGQVGLARLHDGAL